MLKSPRLPSLECEVDDAADRVRRRCVDDPAWPFLCSELRRNAPEADVGRGSGSVELKEGVERTDEGRRCDCVCS